MSCGLMAQQATMAWLYSPLAWGMLIGATGLWLMLAGSAPRMRFGGKLLAAVGLLILAIGMPKLSALETVGHWVDQLVFWLLAGVSLVCAGASITARNPVYTAIWFAGSLLGVSGLFLFQHAQFLGVATVVVYAGAIVVTFLFVLMLANPEGFARYDRVTWSSLAVPGALLAGIIFLLVIAFAFSPPETNAATSANVQAEDHMAQFGTELFAKHLVAVEVAGSLLLVALVGAVAIAIHGKQRRVAGGPLAPANGEGEVRL